MIVAFGPWFVKPWTDGAWLYRRDITTLFAMQTQEQVTTIEEIRNTIALNLKKFRSERGIAQEKLALIAGVDRTMVSKIERQLTNPSIETLLKLANVLDVRVSDLLS
ncbi:helix-turn-helix transcriptional regulator [Limnohabitans sp.]|uniref:helix-turn-helix domain-containing protein n=1 Tax=Limnohabitans sp. TaxID=1907725 RepID=UPI0025BFAD78|nr:helix-turn-helix transcriptional regulator [Limnohabitans sp.]